MDADVEMVERNSGEVGPPDSLSRNGFRESHSHGRFGGFLTCSYVAMAACLLMGLFIITARYQHQVDSSVLAAEKNGKSPDDDLDEIPLEPQYHDDADNKIRSWLDSVVTLRDGVKYEIVQQLKHDKNSFTEGLCYVNGKLYESVGLWRSSAVLLLDPTNGETLHRYDMGNQYFAEGLTYVNGKLIQLTYKMHTGFIYNESNLTEAPSTFEFHSTTNEGWGLTYDPNKNELIESDGSEFLHFWDPDTLQEKRKVAVTRIGGNLANNINELEYWRGRVIANVWFQDVLLVIHPETGIVEKEYGKLLSIFLPASAAGSFDLCLCCVLISADFSALYSGHERTAQGADVLNGISVAEDPDLLYITGKKWDRMFLVR
jgi:glutaminyl-peptide cyclotransferase